MNVVANAGWQEGWLHGRYAEAAGWALVHSVWELSAVALVTGAVLGMCRRRSAAVRYVAGAGGMAGMLAAMVVTFFVMLAPAQVRPAGGKVQETAWRPESGGRALLPGLPTMRREASQAAPVTVSPWVRAEGAMAPYLPDAVAVWLAGMAVCTVRLLWGVVRLRELGRRAVALEGVWAGRLEALRGRLGITRAVRLMESALVDVPTVMGAMRPMILLPASALTGLSSEELMALLAHELAHVRRHDYVANLLQTVLETVLFYHPAMWWLSARVRQERENCCDDVAAAVAGGGLAYARALAAMEALRGGSRRGRLVVAANGGRLMPRIRRLLGMRPAGERRVSVWVAGVMLVVIGAAAYVGCKREAGPTGSAVTAPASMAATVTGGIAGSATTEHLIPYSDLMVYPDNWPEITRHRDETESPANRAVRARLEEVLAEISVQNEELEKVVNTVRERMRINVFVNWAALKAAGVERSTPVTMQLKQAPFRKVLTTLLSQVGDGLVYTLEEGIITISTKVDLAAHQPQVIKVFDIRDLLVMPREGPSPVFSPLEARKTEPAATAGAGGLFDGNGANGAMAQQRAEVVSAIVKTITQTVAPDTWEGNGSSLGSIRELNGQLIVRQTLENQKAIFGLLQQLREARAIQVAVESRLYLVDDATFAALGLAKTWPTGAAVPATAASAGGATLLNDKQLEALLRSLQASPHTSVLTAPRVTLFNGQAGFIASTNQQNYVAGIKVGKDDQGKEMTELDVQTLSWGVILDVSATVTADRKSVVMAVKPSLRSLEKIDTLAQTAPAGREGLAEMGKFVQVPTVRETGLSTMLNVPDGQTAVIGGMKFAGEFPVDQKGGQGWQVSPPAAGASAVRNLLLLVRPQVIVHREVENDLFGPGYDRPTGTPGATGTGLP